MAYHGIPGKTVLIAGGANLVCFTTGRGSALGTRPAPTLKLATNDAAPIVDMPPLNIIINALGAAVDGNGDADVTLAALTGALAWIARRHWPEVSSAIRALNGERMQ